MISIPSFILAFIKVSVLRQIVVERGRSWPLNSAYVSSKGGIHGWALRGEGNMLQQASRNSPTKCKGFATVMRVEEVLESELP
jgi:hypothetical protein